MAGRRDRSPGTLGGATRGASDSYDACWVLGVVQYADCEGADAQRSEEDQRPSVRHNIKCYTRSARTDYLDLPRVRADRARRIPAESRINMSSHTEPASGACLRSITLPKPTAFPPPERLLSTTKPTELTAQQEQWESEGGAVAANAHRSPESDVQGLALLDAIAPFRKGLRPWNSSSLPPSPRRSPWQSSRPWLNQSRRPSTGGRNG